jgi:hypothetical protein
MQRLPRLVVALALISSVTGVMATAQSAQKPNQTAVEYYLAYRAVLAKATSVDDIKPWHSKATRAMMDATPKDESAMMFDIVKMLADVTDLKVVKETKTDAGVTLTVEATDTDKAKTTGEVFLVREDGGWKLDRERWKSGS